MSAMSNRNTVIVIAVVVALWYSSANHQPTPPKPDRPVLSFVARVARLALWLGLYADPPPETTPQQYAARDIHGHRSLRNAEGW